MDTMSRHSVTPYGMEASSGEHGPFMVDPRYPLPSSLPQSQDESPSVNGVARAASRKRRPSGSGTGPKSTNSFPNPPAAPEVPKAPPLSYRPPFVNGVEHRAANAYPGSFAQRAAVLTGRSVPPNIDTAESNSVIPSSAVKRERRTSLNRPIGGVYSEIQQHRRDSYPASGKSPTSPRRASTTSSPQETQLRSPRLSQGDNPANTLQYTNAPTSFDQATPRRASTTLTNPPKEKWASDRSPLQKLEVTMSARSKEEKRARVEEAERRLRDSKLATQEKGTKSQSSEARRASAGGPTIRSIDQSQSRRSTRAREPLQQDLLHDDSTSAPSQAKIVAGKEQNADRGVRFQNTDGPDDGGAEFDSKREDPGFQGTSPRMRSGRRVSLGNRPDSSQQSSTSKQVPLEQQKLYSQRALASGVNDSPEVSGGQVDPIPAQSVASTKQVPKLVVPPQTVGGVQARQKVGFGSGSQQPANVPDHRKQHLSKYLHHGHEPSADLSKPTEMKHRQLDEWRRAGVARLTTEDFTEEAVDNVPWWESSGSNTRRHSQRGSIGTEDTYRDGNGEYRNLLGIEQTGVVARHYVSLDRAQKGSVALLLRLGNAIFDPSGYKQGDSAANLPSAYSYSCSSLAQHEPSHIDHICEPYLSKELTKSMRFVRIRPVPISTAFQPPLYLKCGPLLRYTGMKRDRLQSIGRAGPQSSERETWRGSVMIVTTDATSDYKPPPTLRLFPEPMEKPPPPQQAKSEGESAEDLPIHYMDPVAGLPKLSRTGKTIYVKPVDDLEHGKDLSRFEANDDGLFEDFRSAAVPTAYGTPEYRHGQNGPSPRQSRQKPRQRRGHRVRGVRLHAERGVTFWRFNLEVELQPQETRIAYSINNGPAVGFWVPGRGQTMNTMFHSCNGFSLSVNPDDFSGPDPLWRDVLNSHQAQPFHVMIGGGDQIYNDAVMKQSPLFGDWLEIKNPHHKHEAEFTPALQEELETFYLERYSMWFSQGLFGMANAQIPMVNMWDDHDIIDGFGSYPHHFMSTPVFCGLGAVAFKYYMLFQHQSVPDESSADEPSWLLGAAPGPYINELSRSIYLALGKNVSFLGLDCRTERMREEVLSEASYDLVFDRCRREIIEGETKHLIVLLGVPIAYPRLVWLENVLTSRALDPIKAIGRMGMLGGFLNKFDGGVEILDDLDDHWTAKNHKHERNWFVQELQELAAEKSVRITILGGDVHLAAVGQFFSNPKLKIPKDRDHRYMPNIISSAIVNTPPPEMMSDILNKRNKTHHLDAETDENMIPMFSHDVDGKARNNKRLLPRRNWCSIREYHPGATPPPTPPLSEPETPSDITLPPPTRLQRTLSLTRGDIKPANLVRRLSGRGPPTSYINPQDNGSQSPSPPGDNHFARQPSGKHPSTAHSDRNGPQRHSSAPLHRPGNFLRRPTNMSENAATRGDLDDRSNHINLENGLDIILNCEIDQKDPSGATTPYRLLIPALLYDGDGEENTAAYRRPKLLQRFNSLRGRRISKADDTQEQSGRDNQSFTDSESDGGEMEKEEPMRPRRWSFGLEKRRRYRDQTPPQQRAYQDHRPSSQRNTSDEAQRLGQVRERFQGQQQPQSQRQFEDRPQQIGRSPDEPGDQFDVPAPRRAKKFEYFEDGDYDDDSPPRERMDSIDYHANLDTGQSDQNGYPGRRPSKADRMLGVDDGPSRVPGFGNFNTRDHDEYGNDHRDSKLLPGYGGIDAYSEKDKKGWRRSLKFF